MIAKPLTYSRAIASRSCARAIACSKVIEGSPEISACGTCPMPPGCISRIAAYARRASSTVRAFKTDIRLRRISPPARAASIAGFGQRGKQQNHAQVRVGSHAMARVHRRIQDDLPDPGLGSILKSRTQGGRAEQIILQRGVVKVMVAIHISRFGSAGLEDACQLDQTGNFLFHFWFHGNQESVVRRQNLQLHFRRLTASIGYPSRLMIVPLISLKADLPDCCRQRTG